MKTLEKKHLSAYWPYDLNVMHQSGIIMKMTGERLSGDFLSMESVLDGFGKPILRPLSDLTKEITHNGKTFVPYKVIEQEFNIEDLDKDLNYLIKREDDGNVFISIHKQIQILERLYEWHIDVYNLIEAGLAVDINTLNQTK